MFFRTFSAVLSSLCFAPLMRAFHTFQIVPLYLLITIASGILLMFSIRSILFFWKLLFAALSNSSVISLAFKSPLHSNNK